MLLYYTKFVRSDEAMNNSETCLDVDDDLSLVWSDTNYVSTHYNTDNAIKRPTTVFIGR